MICTSVPRAQRSERISFASASVLDPGLGLPVMATTLGMLSS
jgi:hypothetical protein